MDTPQPNSTNDGESKRTDQQAGHYEPSGQPGVFVNVKQTVSNTENPHQQPQKNQRRGYEIAHFWVMTFTMVATGVAAVVAGVLWDETSDYNRRTLRAYVGVDVQPPRIRPNGEIVAIVKFINSGNTPALNAQTAIYGIVGGAPINTEKNWFRVRQKVTSGAEFCAEIERDPTQGSSPFYVHPENENARSFQFDTRLKLDRETLEKLSMDPPRDGDPSVVYIIGTVCYRDIYKRPQWTAYCAAFHGPFLRLSIPCTQGDEAT